MTTSHQFEQLASLVSDSCNINSDSLDGGFADSLAAFYSNENQTLFLSDTHSINIDETTKTITLEGKASFLNIADINTKLTLWLDENQQAQFIAEYEVVTSGQSGSKWHFSDSFAALAPKGSDKYINTLEKKVTPSLDSLEFKSMNLTVASVNKGEVKQGIYLNGKVSPLGFLGELEKLLPNDDLVAINGQIVLAGASKTQTGSDLPQYPWDVKGELAAGVYLSLSMPLGFDFASAKFASPLVRFYSPFDPSDTSNDFSPVAALTGEFAIDSADVSLDMVTEVDPSAKQVNFDGQFAGVDLAGIDALADMFAESISADLPNVLDDALKPLDKLALQNIDFTLSFNKGMSIDVANIRLGAPTLDWQIWPEHISVNQISSLITVKQPLSKNRDTQVQLWGKSKIDRTVVDIKAQSVKANSGKSMQFSASVGNADDSKPAAIPLKRVMKAYVPSLPAPANLTISKLDFNATINQTYQFSGAIAAEPNMWQLNLGPTKLTIKNIVFALAANKTAGQMQYSGNFSGQLDIGSNISITTSYTLPGDFAIKGSAQKLVFSELLSKLTNQAIDLPDGLDFTLEDAQVLITKQKTGLVLQLAALVKGFGYLAFEVKKTGGKWGAAAGLSLDAGMKLSKLPGLKVLKPVEKIVLMEDFTLVLSTYNSPSFSFPSMSSFESPQLPTTDVQLPATSSGVIKGLNCYGQWKIDNSGKQGKLLRQLLGLEPSIGLTAQISSPVQEASRFYASINTTINGDSPFTGQLGVAMNNNTPEFFASANTTVKIGGRNCNFDMTMSFVTSGAYFTGSMLGTVKVGGLQLSNMVLMTGLSYAGIPSLGVAATLDVSDISSSIALFFDGNDPSKSVFAGAISDISLADVLGVFANVKRLPSGIGDALKDINLAGTGSFTIPNNQIGALDELELDKMTAGFKRYGGISLSDDASLSLVVKTKGKKWSLTDLGDMMKHYSLVKTNKGVVVSLDAQVYVAPQDTKVGALTFKQGMLLNGKLTVLNQAATCHIEVNRSKGIVIDAQLQKALIIYKQAFFCLKASSSQLKKTAKVNPGNKGAMVSIATMNQPKHKVQQFRKPHIYLDGELSMLGLVGSCYVTITSGGCAFDLSIEAKRSIRITGVSGKIDEKLALTGDFTNVNHLSTSIASSFACALKLNLGELGKINFNAKVAGIVTVSYDGKKAKASFAGSFKFQGIKANVKISIGVESSDLKNISKLVAKEVKNEVTDIFDDAERWAKAVKNGLIDGVEGVEEVSKVLQKRFKQDAKAAAKTLKNVGHSMDNIGNSLKSVYKLDSKDMQSALKSAGYATKSVEKFASNAYKDVSNTAKKVGKSIKKVFKF